MSARQPMRVQTLLLGKDMFTRQQAQSWAHYNGYRSGIESGRTYWRLRQAPPTGRVKRAIEFAPGIKAVVQRNPGLPGALWKGLKAGYHLHRTIAERTAMRHRAQTTLNPAIVGRIPGHALEIRYHRTGGQPGRYKHRFEHRVRMYAMQDGSVLLRGTKTLHADDRERDFDHYVHPQHRRRNPMARRSGSGGSLWLLIGLGALLLLRPGALSTGGTTYAPGTVWIDPTDGTMIVGPSQPGPHWRLATQAEIQMAVIPA